MVGPAHDQPACQHHAAHAHVHEAEAPGVRLCVAARKGPARWRGTGTRVHGQQRWRVTHEQLPTRAVSDAPEVHRQDADARAQHQQAPERADVPATPSPPPSPPKHAPVTSSRTGGSRLRPCTAACAHLHPRRATTFSTASARPLRSALRAVSPFASAAGVSSCCSARGMRSASSVRHVSTGCRKPPMVSSTSGRSPTANSTTSTRPRCAGPRPPLHAAPLERCSM